MESNNFIAYNPTLYTEEEMLARSQAFYEQMNQRRSVREYSDKTFDVSILENIIKTANTAPSGAHKQPWTFCIINDPEIKSEIRKAAEAEEYENYTRRMSDSWLKDLEPFGTDHIKPFIEVAPYIVVVMKHSYEFGENQEKLNNYYVNESVGIAVGFFLSAIHNAGLFALTHTPSPMKFLKKILNRPQNETPFLLIPVGLPAENLQVPDIERKKLDQIISRY
jgi:nitroreductase